MNKYINEQILNELLAVNTWSYQENKLFKVFIFNNFKETFQFMAKVAEYAETINHHPEWCNVYNRVEVKLMTHDVNGITDLDFRLAKEMDKIENKILEVRP